MLFILLDKGLFRCVAGLAGELGRVVSEASVDGWQVADETSTVTHSGE